MDACACFSAAAAAAEEGDTDALNVWLCSNCGTDQRATTTTRSAETARQAEATRHDVHEHMQARYRAAFEWAAKHGRLALVRHGYDNDAWRVHVCPQRAFQIAALHGHSAVVQFLCDRGVDPGADDNAALIHAAEEGFLDIVQCLCNLPVERGVDPGAADSKAVFVAARKGHLPVVKFLCETAPERINACAVDNRAIRAAARNGHLAVVWFLVEQFQCVSLDLRGGSCFAAAIMSAAAHGQLHVVKALNEMDPPPAMRWTRFFISMLNDIDDAMTNAIVVAAYGGHVHVVQYLCELPEVSEERCIRATAEHAFLEAAAAGHVEVVQYLWKSQVHHRIKTLITAVACAEHLEVVRYLCDIAITTRVHIWPTWELVNRVAYHWYSTPPY